jgi:hypothetical protein
MLLNLPNGKALEYHKFSSSSYPTPGGGVERCSSIFPLQQVCGENHRGEETVKLPIVAYCTLLARRLRAFAPDSG